MIGWLLKMSSIKLYRQIHVFLVAKKILGSFTENQFLISCAVYGLNVYTARLNFLSWLTNETFEGGLICNLFSVFCSLPLSIIKFQLNSRRTNVNRTAQ